MEEIIISIPCHICLARKLTIFYITVSIISYYSFHYVVLLTVAMDACKGSCSIGRLVHNVDSERRL